MMREDGVDISAQSSNRLDEYFDIDFDYIITVCDHANERCPVFPSNTKKFHHDFPDPAKAIGSHIEIMTQFRDVRDQIKAYCKTFIDQHFDAGTDQ